MSWRGFGVEEGVRRARMLVCALKCVTGTCNTEGVGGQHWLCYANRQHRLSHIPSVRGKGNDTIWKMGPAFTSQLRNADFLSKHQKSS